MALPVWQHTQVPDHESLREALSACGAKLDPVHHADDTPSWVNWEALCPNVQVKLRAYGDENRTPTLEIVLVIGHVEIPIANPTSPEYRTRIKGDAADPEPIPVPDRPRRQPPGCREGFRCLMASCPVCAPEEA